MSEALRNTAITGAELYRRVFKGTAPAGGILGCMCVITTSFTDPYRLSVFYTADNRKRTFQQLMNPYFASSTTDAKSQM